MTDQRAVGPRGWGGAWPPTREAALARIARVHPDAYARTRNHLDGAVTGLSPYLTHGLVTPRDVLARVHAREPLAVQHRLVVELGWREFFRHSWAHEGEGIFSSLHDGPRPDAAYARTLPADIREARTGVPVVDQAVRTLYTTGLLHNHARLWLASYVVHVRQVHWRAGADWLVAHLLDGDLGSNHLSWQWVAGTGSRKPYLFNADNVARYAPHRWHSAGTVIDRSYEDLARVAGGEAAAGLSSAAGFSPTVGPTLGAAVPEPATRTGPPDDLGVTTPDPLAAERLRGREIWLVHPWALRGPPADLPADALCLGLYPREHHTVWPWPEARWRWVDAAMTQVTSERWYADASEVAAALVGAKRVRAVADPHVSRWLQDVALLDEAPSLFPRVEQRCTSFSQWWKHATRGLERVDDLYEQHGSDLRTE